MITIEDENSTELATVPTGDIAKPAKPLTVGELELALLTQFPRADAEEWDRMGLLVGDPAVLVTGVAVALDVTREAVCATERAGANVLLTHHPAFIDPPSAFSPSYEAATPSGVNVYEAASRGIALMNFHTALDASEAVAHLLPGMLSVDFERVLAPKEPGSPKGYGSLCKVRSSDKPFRLSHMAARCTSVFGRMPRVWGDMSVLLDRIAIANGSAGETVHAALAAHADCLVCGEMKYHATLDAVQQGLAIIELGHDVSELPLCAVLAQAAIDAGIPSEVVCMLDQSANWSVPESMRI